jgi:hypothetical protein
MKTAFPFFLVLAIFSTAAEAKCEKPPKGCLVCDDNLICADAPGGDGPPIYTWPEGDKTVWQDREARDWGKTIRDFFRFETKRQGGEAG